MGIGQGGDIIIADDGDDKTTLTMKMLYSFATLTTKMLYLFTTPTTKMLYLFSNNVSP